MFVKSEKQSCEKIIKATRLTFSLQCHASALKPVSSEKQKTSVSSVDIHSSGVLVHKTSLVAPRMEQEA